LTIEANEKVIAPTLTERVYSRLRQMILELELEPGERLVSGEIADRFGVSATPVREAIRLLEKERLVRVVSRKGAIIQPLLSAKEVKDLYIVRSMLEQLAVRLAAKNLSEREINQLERFVDEYGNAVEANERGEALKWDLEFHKYLAEIPKNSTLMEFFLHVEPRVQILRRMDSGSGRRAQSHEDHKEILEALRDGDVDTAAKRMDEHITRGMNHVLSFYEDEDLVSTSDE
jgi:DNA-binding GntR family transcriptional regulator